MESLRKAEGPVLLVDCGAVFDTEPDKAGVLLAAMGQMGYDALNIGGPELQFGTEFLAAQRGGAVPFVASNLLSGDRPAGVQEYLLTEVGGIRIAILGVVGPEDLSQLPNREPGKDLRLVPPETALARLLPEVREKAELVVLLSRRGAEQTRELVQRVRGVDVAISSGDDDAFYSGATDGTVHQTGAQGKSMGMLKIRLDENGGARVIESRKVLLDQSVPDDARVARLVEGFKRTEAQRAAGRETRKERELMQGLRLSPDEFMERYRQEGSAGNPGAMVKRD